MHTAAPVGVFFYLQCFLQIDSELSGSSSQTISLFNGSTCCQVQQLSRPIQLDTSLSACSPRYIAVFYETPRAFIQKQVFYRRDKCFSSHSVWTFGLVNLQLKNSRFDLNQHIDNNAVSRPILTCLFSCFLFPATLTSYRKMCPDGWIAIAVYLYNCHRLRLQKKRVKRRRTVSRSSTVTRYSVHIAAAIAAVKAMDSETRVF